MNDSELDKLLRSGKVPEPTGDYWEEFPRRVMTEMPSFALQRTNESLKHQPVAGLSSALRSFMTRPALAFGSIVLCLGISLIVWYRQETLGAEQKQIAEAQKYFREIERLFPNQLQAIVFEAQGPRLMLSDQPRLSPAVPLYLRLCSPKGCKRFVTFSGQRIRYNNEDFEVLSSRRGEVLLVGERSVWSSSSHGAGGIPFKVEARPLRAAS